MSAKAKRSRRVAVIFHRLGPYHWARLKAAGEVFELLAIEESAETTEYAWDKVGAEEGIAGFTRETLFASSEQNLATPRARFARTASALERWQPEAVAVPGWASPAALAGLDWCARNQRPAVIMSESTRVDRARAGWREAVKRRFVRLGAAGLAGGEPHREYLAELGLPADRVALGYDAVDNAHFAAGADRARADVPAARAALGGLPERFFLASSRFLPQKNLPALLTAFADYRQRSGGAAGGAWSLVLLGDGPMRAELLAHRDALGLDRDPGALLLPGFKQYPQLPAYYGLAGGFVHASTSEPWGLVVNEALASGVPVVVSERCGCARDLVINGVNGWTFAPEDVPGLANRLAALAALEPAVRAAMGEAARMHVAPWGPERFARGLGEALTAAGRHPLPRVGFADRTLLRLAVRIMTGGGP